IKRADEGSEITIAPELAETSLGVVDGSTDPADEHPAVAPPADVAREVADEPVEILDHVCRPQRLVERAADTEALQGESVREPFAQGVRGSRMRRLQARGQPRKAPFGERGV